MKCQLTLVIISLLLINQISMVLSSLSINRMRFKKPEEFKYRTPENEAGKGSIFYLDRHKIDCSTQSALSGLEFQRNNERIYYSFNCKQSLAISKINKITKFTPWNDVDRTDENSTNFLDRHNLQCEYSHALSGFQLIRDNRKISYRYECVKIKITDCKEENTNETYGGEKRETYYLDRQKILLPTDRVLTRLSLTTRYDGKAVYYRYSYTSCQLQDVEIKVAMLKNAISELEKKAYLEHPKKIEENENLIKQKKEENLSKNQKISELNKFINELSSKTQELANDNQNRKSEENKKTVEKSYYKNKSYEKSLEINHLNNNVLEKSYEIGNLEKRNNELSSDIKTAEERKAVILNHIQSIKKEISEKEKLITLNNDEIIKNKNLITETTRKKDEDENKIPAMNNEINTLNSKNDNLKKDNDDAQGLISKNLLNIGSLDKDIKTKEDEIARLNKEIIENQALITNATKERDDIINRKKDAEAKLVIHKKELEFYEQF